MPAQVNRMPLEKGPLQSAYIRDASGDVIEIGVSTADTEDDTTLLYIEIEEDGNSSWYSNPRATMWMTEEEATVVRDILSELLEGLHKTDT